MKRTFYFILIMLCFQSNLWAQTFDLSDELDEISGLEMLNDSTFVALNDGGHEATLYLLNIRGKIIKKVKIENAKNVDWEDIAVDDKNIYIADVGNNTNKRKDLLIYKVSIKKVLEKKEVEAKKIKIKYKEQKEYPPKKGNMRFDAEAITVYNDSIFLFTKNRSNPTDGRSWVYKFSTSAGEYKLKKKHEIFIGRGGFWKDAVTAVDVKGNDFYISTYNRILKRTYADGFFTGSTEMEYNRLSQKESLVIIENGGIVVADEKQVLFGGPKLYYLEPKFVSKSKD
ncbi:MAG: hypothetical protein P8M19_05310 [Crocinitomicaceae bacterium]|nr:hypothetical protein [Crocinitomicaceae bacterium]MDG1657649.1 hypothetical protein [Crocinitomicaceae bacterium]MDG2441069.1 hypothetical protein [Crocinitomicaceae bacterium]